MCSLSSLVAVYTLPLPGNSNGVSIPKWWCSLGPYGGNILALNVEYTVHCEVLCSVTNCFLCHWLQCTSTEVSFTLTVVPSWVGGWWTKTWNVAISVLLTRTVNWWWPLNWWWGWRRAHMWRGSGWHIEAGEKKNNNSSTITELAVSHLKWTGPLQISQDPLADRLCNSG